MKKRIHGAAGILGFVVILVFRSSTVVSELAATPAAVATVKNGILWRMALLVPVPAITGVSGLSMARGRRGGRIERKRRRVPVIALNGLLVLVPSAFFLTSRANAGVFDTAFQVVQGIELFAGAVDPYLMAENVRDGPAMSGRF